MTYDEIRGI